MQSRAKVKKKAAKSTAGISREALRKEGLALAKEQAEVSKRVAAAVQQVAADVRIQRQQEEEAACRKRKQGAIGDLRMEMDSADPVRTSAIRTMIGKLYRENVAEFTAEFTAEFIVDIIDTDAPPAVSTTVATSALPGFA